MKICLLHFTAPPLVGGVETTLARQAQQLARAGHLLRILAGRGQTWDARIPVEILPRLDLRHPQVLRVKADLEAGPVPPEFNDLVQQIEADLRRATQGCDVLIAHNVATSTRHLALTAALYNLSQSGRGPRLILWHHDFELNADLPGGDPWDLLRTPWPGVKHVTVSEPGRQALAALLGLPLKAIHVIPAGLSFADFLNLSPRTLHLVEDLQLASAAPILITPVRLARRKNLELALEMLAELRRKLPNAALLITGPAHSESYFEELQKLRSTLKLQGAAILLGEFVPDGLPESGLAELYRLADALFLPSREEGFGMPLLEAGLAGLPIFCSNLPALQALAGENAVYFSPEDSPKEIAVLVAARLQADPLYRMRVRVRHEFTWEVAYHAHITSLLEA